MTDNLQWLRDQAEVYDSVGEPGAYEYGCRLTAAAGEIERLRTTVDAMEATVVDLTDSNAALWEALEECRRLASAALEPWRDKDTGERNE